MISANKKGEGIPSPCNNYCFCLRRKAAVLNKESPKEDSTKAVSSVLG